LSGRFGTILRIRRSPAYRPVSADSGHSSGTSALHSPVTKRLATSESTKPSLTQ
jgi:hypothetical protein